MYRATKDIKLPTTYYRLAAASKLVHAEFLGSRSFLDAMVNNQFREQYVDTVSIYVHEQDIAGLDIVTDGDAHFDSDVGGQVPDELPPRHMGGFDRHNATPTPAGTIGFPPNLGRPILERASCGSRAATRRTPRMPEVRAAPDQQAG